MMKHVAAALALTSLTGVAQASPQFPAEMLGTWCAMEHGHAGGDSSCCGWKRQRGWPSLKRPLPRGLSQSRCRL